MQYTNYTDIPFVLAVWLAANHGYDLKYQPDVISATATVGVRVPDHPVARQLLSAAGPMAVTSANISGQPSPVSADEVMAQLGERIPLILDGGLTPGGVPSTVVSCLGAEPTILREGPLSKPQILLALGLE